VSTNRSIGVEMAAHVFNLELQLLLRPLLRALTNPSAPTCNQLLGLILL